MSNSDDKFWEAVDTIFATAAENGTSAIVLAASALNNACFSAHMMKATREDFVAMAAQAWDHSLDQIRYIRAEQNLEEGKCAKA